MRRAILDTKEKRKQLIEKIFNKLNLNSLEEWYGVSRKDFYKEGGRNLLENYYNGSLRNALKEIYPEKEWKTLKFSRLPHGYFNDVNNRKDFFTQLSSSLSITSPSQWHSISNSQVIEKGGAYLLNHYYGGSIKKMVEELLPELHFSPFLHSKTSHKYFHSLSNQRDCFQHISLQMNIKKMEDWYDISVTHLFRNFKGFSTIFRLYNYSMIDTLQAIYPDYQWDIHRFKRKPQSFWLSEDNQRSFLHQLYHKRGMKSMEEWNNVKNEEIMKEGGSGLLGQYKGSLFSALQSLYPSIDWHPLNKPHSHKRFLYLPFSSSTKLLLEKLQQKVEIRRKKDWFRISKSDLTSSLQYNLNLPHFLYQLLSHVYPDQNWNFDEFSNARSKRSKQRTVFIHLKKIIPHHEIIEEYLSPSLVYSKSRVSIEIDLFVPSLSLGVEYNGEQHYNEIAAGFNVFEVYLLRDREKQIILHNANVNLLIVPYWWDLSLSSLFSSLLLSFPFLNQR